jgi:hypothetical protein
MTNALQYSAGTIYYFGKRLLMDQLKGATVVGMLTSINFLTL